MSKLYVIKELTPCGYGKDKECIIVVRDTLEDAEKVLKETDVSFSHYVIEERND